MPRVASAGHSSKPNQILHAALTAILLAAVTTAALTLLTLRPLEMLCGAVIVWRSRGGA